MANFKQEFSLLSVPSFLPFHCISFSLSLLFSSAPLFPSSLSSTSLVSIDSSQGGYAAYRYAQPAAVATPAAAAAAAAAYSDR